MKIARKMFAAGGCVVVGLAVVAGAAAQADPAIGRWTLNVAKSTFDPGPPPKSETRVYEAFGPDGIKATFTRVTTAGQTVTITYAAKYDGKDYPLNGVPDADALALTQVDARTVDAALKKGGNVVQTARAVISSDGKMFTVTVTGTSASGRRINNVSVFEKQ